MDLEKRVHDSLPPTKQRRLRWLVAARKYAAQAIAEASCLGLHDAPGLDRQVVLAESAIEDLIPDRAAAAALMAEYAVSDAALIHNRGDSPLGFDCAVCSGRYGIESILARIADLGD
ncbi:hypothetical protein EKO23_16370 [Nocardioides guangzhouensis]|uniref:Uncharacterized protein n=1 Tax=Nocardioides guangzhouensis TaxID=2497878 RepID=A0A4Q4Z9T0_9ACTN|nr:hypothetical protein [Nocardioides guangzhouensis]RYP84235.1 hypothetical protein EKO23_16370 [Nocardioides guangzhouensis]